MYLQQRKQGLDGILQALGNQQQLPQVFEKKKKKKIGEEGKIKRVGERVLTSCCCWVRHSYTLYVLLLDIVYMYVLTYFMS